MIRSSGSPGIRQIAFVARDGNHYVRRTVLAKFLYPVLQGLEGLLKIQKASVHERITPSFILAKAAERLIMIFLPLYLFCLVSVEI